MSVIEILEADRRRGEQLKELVVKDRTKIEPRVEPGTIDGMIADLVVFQDEAVGATVLRQAKRSATRSVGNAAQILADTVQAVRNAGRLKKLDAEVLSMLGVGRKLDPRSVKSVLDGADMVAMTYTRHPDQLRRAGVLPADIERISALRTRLTTDDMAQEAQKTTSKEKTAARNAAHKRVQAAIASIVAAAELAFVDNPERLAMYRAVLPTKPGARKSPAPVA
jgi:hypothetical protein